MVKQLDQFWVLDFDRCLLDVDKAYHLYESLVIQETAIDIHLINEERESVESRGGSYALTTHLRQLLGEDELDRINKLYRQSPSSNLLNPGAEKLLSYIHSHVSLQGGIVSFGDPEWQYLKISAAGLSDYPVFITDTPEKSRLIASWWDGAVFAIPPSLRGSETVTASEIILVDDKATAFDDLPQHARGYWFRATRSLLPSQQGAVPVSVTEVIGSLERVIELERKR